MVSVWRGVVCRARGVPGVARSWRSARVEWRGVVRHGAPRYDVAWRGVAWCAVAWRARGVAQCGVAGCGMMWRCVAWRGVAWAWRGVARACGVAWQGAVTALCAYFRPLTPGGVHAMC